jgi:prophage regulatory protein
MRSARRLIGDAELRRRGITYTRQHRKVLQDEGRFPASVKGVGKADAWVEDEIDEYIETRIRERDAKHAGSPEIDDTDKADDTSTGPPSIPERTAKVMPASTPKTAKAKRSAPGAAAAR